MITFAVVLTVGIVVAILVFRTAHGAIAGAVYVQLRSGSSEILRGQRVYLLIPTVPNAIAQDIIQSCRAIYDSFEGGAYLITDQTARQVDRDRSLGIDVLSRLERITSDVPTEDLLHLMDLARSFIIVSNVPYEVAEAAFDKHAVIELTKVAAATTNVDGKYHFADIPAGSYVVASTHSRPYGRGQDVIYWRVPVVIPRNRTAQVDLNNGNGRSIRY